MPGYRPIPPGAIKIALPTVAQREPWTCGASALLAVCAYYGVGPNSEREIARDMRMTRDGSDPRQLVRAAQRYGLQIREHRPMSDATLRKCLDARHPVIVMLQAWGRPGSYRERWRDGHWLVAIGHARAGVFFEDPLLDRARGFLSWATLEERWHDLEGDHGARVRRYGLEVWRGGVESSQHERHARLIE